MDIACQLLQAGTAGNGKSQQGKERHEHAGRDKAPVGSPEMGTRQLSHMDRKDQIAGAEQHAEQHRT